MGNHRTSQATFDPEKSRQLYQGTIDPESMQTGKLYQGTINSRNINYQRTYRGNIHSQLQQGLLYQGSIQADGFKPRTYKEAPGRRSPQVFARNVDGQHPKVHEMQKQEKNNQVAQNQTKMVERINKEEKRHSGPAMAENLNKPNMDRQVRFAGRSQDSKLPVRAPNPRKSKHKSQGQGHKISNRVSPFPPSSPEPVRPHDHRNLELQLFRYQTTEQGDQQGPVFPPIMPVSMEDYAESAPAHRAAPPHPRGNPLIPAMGPALGSHKSLVMTAQVPRESYENTTSPSVRGVPGFNTVGSVLRGNNLYY